MTKGVTGGGREGEREGWRKEEMDGGREWRERWERWREGQTGTQQRNPTETCQATLTLTDMGASASKLLQKLMVSAWQSVFTGYFVGHADAHLDLQIAQGADV